MLIRKALLFILSISILQCCAHNLTSTGELIVPWEMPKPDVEQRYLFTIFDFNGFTNEGSVMEVIYKPFIVREIKGRLLPYNTDRTWYEALPLFELRALGKGTKISRVRADKNGFFVMKNIPEGLYCYSISCLGWHVYMGVVIVDKKANPESTISILMYPEG